MKKVKIILIAIMLLFIACKDFGNGAKLIDGQRKAAEELKEEAED